MSGRALPASEMGPRKSEKIARDRRRHHFQRLRVLQHRLPERIVQGSGKERIALGSERRKIHREQTGRRENRCGNIDGENVEQTGQGIQFVIKLICPECQRENEADRIYCHDCGSRLDRSAASSRLLPKETMVEKQRRVRKLFDARRAKIRFFIMRTAKLLLGALALAALIQMILPPDVPPPPRENTTGISQVNFDLEDALNRHNGTQLKYSEDQVNEHLRYTLKTKQSALNKPFLEFKRVVAQIREDICAITVERSIFGFSIYTSGSYSVRVNAGKTSVTNKGGTIGRLQIHPAVFKYIEGIFSDLWAALDRERKLVTKMNAVEFHDKAILLIAPGRGQ
jgi:hypothetical protein